MTITARTSDERLALTGAFILRLALGVVFIAHALAKVFLFTLPGTAAFFEAHGYPGWAAYPVFAAELVGGVLLMAGVLTRWVSLALIPVMLGALLVHLPNGWFFSSTRAAAGNIRRS
jgi:putative oxidoreductase